MSVCYFNGKKDENYKCTYVIDNDISISVDYDISDEVDSHNGIIIWSSSTQFKSRDIVIADPENSSYIFVRNAYYSGMSFR